SFELAPTTSASFTPGTPATDATKGKGAGEKLSAYNRAAVPTMVVTAGATAFTGDGTTPFARLTWPLAHGTAKTSDVVLRNPRASDELGVTRDATSQLSVCGVEHLLGVLPPRVALGSLPSTTAVASLVIVGTVQSSDLANCTAVLTFDGVSTNIDVT